MDGFRSICFRDGDEVQPGSRYFAELVAAGTAELPQGCVIDGEIVIAGEQGLDFETLQLHLHPGQTPASLHFLWLHPVIDRMLPGCLGLVSAGKFGDSTPCHERSWDV